MGSWLPPYPGDEVLVCPCSCGPDGGSLAGQQHGAQGPDPLPPSPSSGERAAPNSQAAESADRPHVGDTPTGREEVLGGLPSLDRLATPTGLGSKASQVTAQEECLSSPSHGCKERGPGTEGAREKQHEFQDSDAPRKRTLPCPSTIPRRGRDRGSPRVSPGPDPAHTPRGALLLAWHSARRSIHLYIQSQPIQATPSASETIEIN